MPQRPAQKKKKPAVVQETRRATSVAVGEAALQAQIESGDTITDGVRLFLAMLADQQPSRGLPRTVSRQHKGFTESFWQDMRVRLAPTKKSASEWHEQNQKTLNNVFTNNGQEQLYNKRGWLFASRGKSYRRSRCRTVARHRAAPPRQATPDQGRLQRLRWPARVVRPDRVYARVRNRRRGRRLSSHGHSTRRCMSPHVPPGFRERA
jgi:hypothetical protein